MFEGECSAVSCSFCHMSCCKNIKHKYKIGHLTGKIKDGVVSRDEMQHGTESNKC